MTANGSAPSAGSGHELAEQQPDRAHGTSHKRAQQQGSEQPIFQRLCKVAKLGRVLHRVIQANLGGVGKQNRVRDMRWRSGVMNSNIGMPGCAVTTLQMPHTNSVLPCPSCASRAMLHMGRAAGVSSARDCR